MLRTAAAIAIDTAEREANAAIIDVLQKYEFSEASYVACQLQIANGLLHSVTKRARQKAISRGGKD